MSAEATRKDSLWLLWPAEGVGFEPTMALRPFRFSRPVDSTTLAPFRAWLMCCVTNIGRMGSKFNLNFSCFLRIMDRAGSIISINASFL